MDLRRPPRSSSGGVEPKIRQVGFFTPDASASGPSEAPAAAAAPQPQPQPQQPGAATESPPASRLSPGRLSPIMIPPPRHADHLTPGSPSPAGAGAVLATSAPAASPARFDAASVVGDDDSWSRAPSAAELGNPRTQWLAEARMMVPQPPFHKTQKTEAKARRALQEAQRAASCCEGGRFIWKIFTLLLPAKSNKSLKPAQKLPQAAKDSSCFSERKDVNVCQKRRKKDAPHPRMQLMMCIREVRIVVDSRPKLEGQGLLRRLVAKGIDCTYTHINAISYIMHEVTRVFLGASSVLSNGTVYSRVGTASVAMVAHAFGIPVLVCCEAYKFHERVQLDSICANELGDPDVILKVPGKADLDHLKDWADNANLQLLNLTYDATPSDYVSMIITDYGMLPPTSVPVIVREYRKEQLWI
ncbi:hypothetical protein PR202_gb11627 [Eleusine coracana subsp. coracana]|uniref:Translation initiation factor eIF2B subunit delta n=1 Tax=Eleusine coracana subsp. coracana TaxID=191504 RepID=A0AAV5ENG9_ELECO|nr:hypothetical protein PR202_gb11627 [Eleusine coracana subsp. coracana]